MTLFLDFDGTLLELRDHPGDVVADEPLRALLRRLAAAFEGRVAVISGRSIAQLDDILGPVAQDIALSGSHGSEHRWNGISARPHRPSSLDTAAERFRRVILNHPGTLIEEKSFGVALHYRLCPEAEDSTITLARRTGLELGLELQLGKMMVELRVPGGDKGAAIRRMMRLAAMIGTKPVFIGDDVTDEQGFEAVAELHGIGIFVGEPRATAARFGLPHPAAVRDWLTAAVR